MKAAEPAAAGIADRPVRLGLRANIGQFTLLVAVNALVCGMVGQERTVLPLLGLPVEVGTIIDLPRRYIRRVRGAGRWRG